MLCPSLMWCMNAENDMTWDYGIEAAYKNSAQLCPLIQRVWALKPDNPQQIQWVFIRGVMLGKYHKVTGIHSPQL